MNVTDLRPDPNSVRTARAQHMHGLLKADRWSISAAALQLGINKSVLASRMNGTTAFLADEIEAIAGLLRRDAVTVYMEYLSAGFPDPGTNNAPTANGEGENVGPAGIEPTTSTV